MDFDPDPDLEAIREGVRRVCAKFPDTYWRERDSAHEFPWLFYDAMAEGGWIGIAIPEEYGGGGRGITEASVVVEEVAASGAAMNGASALHLSIFGMNPVLRHGSDEMKARYLSEVAAGRLHVAFGVTEPDAGTDTTAVSTRARRDGDAYIVRGRKVWTTKATVCQKVLLLVRTTPLEECTRRTDGMTLLLADLQRPEVTITPIPKVGRNAVVSCEVVYDDLPVRVSDRVGEEGEGFRYLLDGLNPERILIASEALGVGKVALRRAVQYAQDRVVFGRPIGKNQGVAFPLAEAHLRLHAAELAIREASWRYDRGMPCGEQANSAKYLAADAGWHAADQAMQTHGGFGYASEYDVERYWREARLMRIAPVSQEMVLNFVAEHVLGLPRELLTVAALDGVHVVDASSFLTGPYAALIMGDLGADVIKVEPPERGDPYRRFGRQHRGHGIPFANTNRNKRSVALDLSTSADRDAFERLLDDSDVLITNWRPAVAARLGLEGVTTRHPRLIWIRITGFGPDGPAAEDPAFDSIIQARVGLASTQGKDGAPALGTAWICDKATGMFAAQAALAAIVERHRTGRGRDIDISMLDTMAYFDFPDVMVERTVIDDAPESPHNRHLSSLRPVRTSDGWIVVNLVRGRHISNAFAALGLQARQAEVRGITDPALLSSTLCDIVETATSNRTTAECVALFASCDVPAGAVLDLDQHLSDPQVAHNHTYVEVDDPNLGRVRRPRIPGAALARDDASQLPSPLLDEHRATVLRS